MIWVALAWKVWAYGLQLVCLLHLLWRWEVTLLVVIFFFLPVLFVILIYFFVVTLGAGCFCCWSSLWLLILLSFNSSMDKLISACIILFKKALKAVTFSSIWWLYLYDCLWHLLSLRLRLQLWLFTNFWMLLFLFFFLDCNRLLLKFVINNWSLKFFYFNNRCWRDCNFAHFFVSGDFFVLLSLFLLINHLSISVISILLLVLIFIILKSKLDELLLDFLF